MVMTALPISILAAPQQSPSAQVASSLLGLKVPFDIAFSHLAPAAPLVGAASLASSMSFAMAARSVFLLVSAVASAVAYLSYWSSLHFTSAARCKVVAAATSPFLSLMSAF